MQNYMNLINKELEKAIKCSKVKKYVQGGKRIRPLACILAYKSIVDNDNIILPSTSLELIHNSTLIHDDIMDEDNQRRNNPTLHKVYEKQIENDQEYNGDIFHKLSTKYGVSRSIMRGTDLTLWAFNQIQICNFPDKLKLKAFKLLNNTLQNVNKGQVQDIQNNHTTEQQYLEMIENKTACLIASSFQLGALFAEKYETEFYNLGLNLGIAFQIQDDLLDLKNEKGRLPYSDIKNKKNTILKIKAQELANLDNKTTKEILEIYNKGPIEYANQIINEKINKTTDILNNMPNNDELKKFISIILNRNS